MCIVVLCAVVIGDLHSAVRPKPLPQHQSKYRDLLRGTTLHQSKRTTATPRRVFLTQKQSVGARGKAQITASNRVGVWVHCAARRPTLRSVARVIFKISERKHWDEGPTKTINTAFEHFLQIQSVYLLGLKLQQQLRGAWYSKCIVSIASHDNPKNRTDRYTWRKLKETIPGMTEDSPIIFHNRHWMG